MDQEDISKFVKTVEFVLDKDTFSEPEIRIMQPPFEIHETGWGEFQIGVNLYFHDESLDPIHYFKHLHLFDSQNLKKARVAEDYNELVFVNPSVAFLPLLQSAQKLAPQEEQ